MEVGISGLESEQGLLDQVDRAADACLEAAEGRPVVFRLSLTGRGPLHRWLRREDTAAGIRERINERYAGMRDWMWCERILRDTGSPVDLEQVALREDFAGDLARLGREMRQDPQALAGLRESLRALYVSSNASQHLRSHLPSDEELRELLGAAEDECLAALVGDEDEG